MKPRRSHLSRPSSSMAAILSSVLAYTTLIYFPHSIQCFVGPPASTIPAAISSASTSALGAIGVFVRKAKEADVRKYCEEGPSESVLALLKQIKDAAAAATDDAGVSDEATPVGEIQSQLTKRKGTITIIAEYKRKVVGSGFLSDILPPEILSPVFREFGASAIAVLADERTGGCSYEDITTTVQEQNEAQGEVPGPLPVISSDLIVDEIQIAQAADAGAKAITLTYGVWGSGGDGGSGASDKVRQFIQDAKSVGLEVIVNVGSADEAQGAVDAGASMISVVGVDGADNKYAVIENLVVPPGRQICTIANILAKDNKAMEEVEEAWMCRDKGFNCVWVSDALYKAGNDPVEHPGAIINSMKAKSSVKYASPKARSGKGE
ncbi:hypothetical protein ACHAXH_008762, partial [Discostella pseudostelligera]